MQQNIFIRGIPNIFRFLLTYPGIVKYQKITNLIIAWDDNVYKSERTVSVGKSDDRQVDIRCLIYWLMILTGVCDDEHTRLTERCLEIDIVNNCTTNELISLNIGKKQLFSYTNQQGAIIYIQEIKCLYLWILVSTQNKKFGFVPKIKLFFIKSAT